MAELKTQLLVPFSLGTGGLNGQPLKWTFEAGITSGADLNTIKLRLYPNVSANVAVNRGGIVFQTSFSQNITREVVTFTGSNSATTEFPVVGSPTVTSLGFLFNPDGTSAGSVSFTFENGALLASKQIVGVVEVSYPTSYRLYKYTYEVIGNTTFGGYAFAFFSGSIAVQAIEPFSLALDDFVEFYRLYSEAVITEDGEFEKPPGWTPGTPTFFDPPNDDIPATDGGAVLIQRVHEQGLVNNVGQIRILRNNIFTAAPFSGSFNYTIPTGVSVASPGQDGAPPTAAQLASPILIDAIQSAQARATGLV